MLAPTFGKKSPDPGLILLLYPRPATISLRSTLMAFSTTQKLFHALFTPNLRDRVNTCYHLSFPRRKREAPPMEPRV